MLQTWNDAMHSGNLDSWSNYAGDTALKDWYIAGSKTAASTPLDRANFDATLTRLGGESDNVRIAHFGHWACGWLELILIAPHAHDALTIAEEIATLLQNYPVLDDELCSEYEYAEALNTWRGHSLRERIHLCARYDESIFSARRDCPPDNDSLYDYLRS